MTARQLRRSQERKERKLARKNLSTTAVVAENQNEPKPFVFPTPEQIARVTYDQIQAEIAAYLAEPYEEDDEIAKPATPAAAAPKESTYTITPARQAASRENGRLSHGALTPESKAISAQNHTSHGLARHQSSNFKIFPNEDPSAFESLKNALIAEHNPATETESILVTTMAESRWLALRAQRLQDTCLHPETGEIENEKKFSLYMRYLTFHTRAFHKNLSDLLKLRKEKRQADLGVEAQRLQNEANTRKKLTHTITLFQKDLDAQLDLADLTTKLLHAEREIPGFPEKFNAALAKMGLDKEWWAAAA